jgi:YVTN family beta-propeller protein
MTGSRLFLCCALLLPAGLADRGRAASSSGFLVVANQGDHTALIVDITRSRTIASVTVGVNGHELAVSPDGRFAYVPIYGNSGVGRPGTDGRTIDIVDLREHKLAGTIELGKPVRPHCARFGPNGLLYVTAELSDAVYAVDVKTRNVVAEIPTGARESHMMVLSPDGRRAYTANVGAGSVSVLDLEKHSLVTVLGIGPTIQRISISPDGRYVFTHDQTAPHIAVIDTRSNEVVRWIPVPAIVYSSAVAPDNRTLVANSPSGKLFVVDIVTGNVEESIDIPKAIGEIALTPDGRMAYVSCPQAGTIESINLETGKHTGTIVLTKGADGLAWVPSLPSF